MMLRRRLEDLGDVAHIAVLLEIPAKDPNKASAKRGAASNRAARRQAQNKSKALIRYNNGLPDQQPLFFGKQNPGNRRMFHQIE